MGALDEVDIASAAAEHGVPGAAVGLLVDGEIDVRACGVLNTATGVNATPETLFQIGSITKLWTATVLVQLAEQGAIDLDAPVHRYVPGFRVGDDHEIARAITIRQLLIHTSGIADDFTPTTRGDDAVQRYVDDVVPTLAIQFPPGTQFDYSNAGYVVLGRIAEIHCGKPYHEVLQDRIAAPLGIERWAPTPEQALLFRTAVGHVPATSRDGLQPAATWSMSAAHSPAGSQVAMTARSLLNFAGAFLRGGAPLVSRGTVRQMWSPDPNAGELGGAGGQLAIGGVIQRVDGRLIVGYDGATHGQSASLRIIPDAGVAVASLANGGDMFAFHQAVLGQIVTDSTGLRLPTPPVPPEEPEPVEVRRVCGRYRGHDLEVVVSVGDRGQVQVAERPLTDALKALLSGGNSPSYVRLSANELIGTSQRIGVHPIITLRGEPTAPATAIVHFGRVLNRLEQPREATDGAVAP